MIRWYTCSNQQCKSQGESFTLLFENVWDKEICPFCHQSANIVRNNVKEQECKRLRGQTYMEV